MKKRAFFKVAMLAVASMGFLASCGDDTEPTPGGPDDPALAALAADNGTVEIFFTNIAGTDPSISAAAGQNVTVSVRIKKTPDGSRPQKLRVWDATKEGTRGTQYGTTIDLRNIDDQTKTVDYVVPSVSGTRYVYFEVDESNSKFQRKLLKVSVSGTATVASWTGLVLGAQNNPNGSRVASATGDIYTVCDVAENMKYIDLTYALLPNNIQNTPTILSNPQRAIEGLATTSNPPATSPCAGTSINTGGGRATYFAVATETIFNTADETVLKNLSVSATNPQKITVAAGKVYAFQNSDGKKGLIRVSSLDLNSTNGGTITIDVKVQR